MKKILCLVMVLFSLLITHNVWFSYKGKIILDTNLPQETPVILQSRKNLKGDLLTTESKADESGRVHFDLADNKISWFKITVPENATVKKTTFRGRKRHTIELNTENEYTGKALYTNIQLHWLHVIIIAILGWYLGWFLSYAFKNGIPKDDYSKLPKMQNIEFLRIAFTVCIILCHFVAKLDIWNNGRLAVEFFFMLSGFLLVLTFRPDKTIGNFIVSKWIRFMPLIVFGGLISCLFAQDINIQYFIEQSIFIADNFLFSKVAYNGPAWYIFVLFWVSLLYFYALKSFKKESVDLWIAISSIIAAAYVLIYNSEIHGIISAKVMQGFACMGIGYFLAKIYQKIKDRHIIHQNAYNLCELSVLIFAILNILYKPLFMGRLITCMAFAIVILMFVLRKGVISQFFEKPIFAKMARYSLAVYLTHRIVTTSIFPIYLQRHKDFCMQNSYIPITAVLICAILLGIIAHHMVEIPITRILTKWVKDGEPRK